jgi:hypothetical protein
MELIVFKAIQNWNAITCVTDYRIAPSLVQCRPHRGAKIKDVS